MIVKCEKHPSLYIYDLNVKFVRGEVEVTDKKALAKMKEMGGFEFAFAEESKLPE